MLVKLRLLGSGTRQDPYRVSLPTYTHVHGNITQGYAIVDIPDNVHELDLAELESEKADNTTEGQVYHLSDANLSKLHMRLDEKYLEHKGEFRLEQV